MIWWSCNALIQGVRWYEYSSSISWGLRYLSCPLEKVVRWHYSPLKPGTRRPTLFLNKFKLWYHLRQYLNNTISTDDFINYPSLLDSNPANFSTNLYYNIFAGSLSKALVFGTNTTSFQSTSKYLVNMFPMPYNFSSLSQLIPSIKPWKAKSEGAHNNKITTLTIILDSTANINFFSTWELLDGIHYDNRLKKEVTGVSGQLFWCG